MAKVQTFYPYHIDNEGNYQKALNDITNKLTEVKKRISYFDAYTITDVVTDSSNFASKTSTLPLNQALVINTSPFIYSGVTYSPGDVVLKLQTGELCHIKAQTGGFYYPFKITKNEKDATYYIEYQYSANPPAENETVVNVGNNESVTGHPTEKITFQNISEIDVSSIYGIWTSDWTDVFSQEGDKIKLQHSFKAYFTTGLGEGGQDRAIKPFIQFFMQDVDEETGEAIIGEQVYIDYSLTFTNKDSNQHEWTVEISPEASGLYMKVK